MKDFVICLECNKKFKVIKGGHLNSEGCSGNLKNIREYKDKYPNAKTICDKLRIRIELNNQKENNPNWKGGIERKLEYLRQNYIENDAYVICRECGFLVKTINSFHLQSKNCTRKLKNVKQYQRIYPGAKTICEQHALKISKLLKGKHCPTKGYTKENNHSLKKASETLARNFKSMTREEKNEWIRIRRIGNRKRPTKIELVVAKLLDFFYPSEFTYNGNNAGCVVNGKVPDFVHKNENIVILVNGNYWHGKGKTGVDNYTHEQMQVQEYNNFGYRCIVFWEADIYSSNFERSAIEKLSKYLGKGGEKL